MKSFKLPLCLFWSIRQRVVGYALVTILVQEELAVAFQPQNVLLQAVAEQLCMRPILLRITHHIALLLVCPRRRRNWLIGNFAVTACERRSPVDASVAVVALVLLAMGRYSSVIIRIWGLVFETARNLTYLPGSTAAGTRVADLVDVALETVSKACNTLIPR